MKQSLLVTLLSILCWWIGGQSALALDQKDGVYQINNAQDLEEFSNLVASGNGNVSAVVTADIDMTGVNRC